MAPFRTAKANIAIQIHTESSEGEQYVNGLTESVWQQREVEWMHPLEIALLGSNMERKEKQAYWIENTVCHNELKSFTSNQNFELQGREGDCKEAVDFYKEYLYYDKFKIKNDIQYQS